MNELEPALPAVTGTDAPDSARARLSALAEELRASGAIGRSEVVTRLFDFLLEQSLAGRSPKEFEIAQEVFGKGAEFDVAQDASVRVHIHRLRKKLDEIYAGSAGTRLTVPRGEYRVAVVDGPADVSAAPEPATPEDSGAIDIPEEAEARFRAPTRRANRLAIAGLCIAFLAGLAGGALLQAVRAAPAPLAAAAGTPFWGPLAASTRPTFIVTGDYYLFGEAPNTVQLTRLVRDFTINSNEDLAAYLMNHPDDIGRYVDLDLHYLPVSTGHALRELLPLVNGISNSASMGRPWSITMSRLTPEAMKGSNIVYVGFLSALGLIRDPLFDASGFAVGASYDELIDKATGKHYSADWDDSEGNRAPRRDFAYLASFPGPSGNRILVIAGTRDAAVMQASEIAADKAQLDQIARRVGDSDAFEALYEVRTLNALNLGSSLVVARPLKRERLWRPGTSARRFPDKFDRAPTGSATNP